MAIYILAGSSDRPTGSRAGATFQRAGVQYIIRRRNVPCQKRTPSQSITKNRFDHVRKEWKTLSPMQKTSFEDETLNYPRLNSLGDTYYLRGNTLHASSNLSLLTTGSPEIVTMPAPAIFPAWTINSAQIFFATTDALFSITQNPIPAGLALRFLMSRPYPTQEERPTLPLWQIAQFTEGDDCTTFNWWQRFVSLFGNNPAYIGQYFHCVASLISLDTGQQDIPLSTVGLITN